MTVNRAPAVLIVDDEQPICELLCEVLGEQGYLCQSVNSGDEALALLKEKEFDLALLDIKMPGMSGIDLLGTISASYRNTSVLMTTAVNDMNTVVEAMQRGARIRSEALCSGRGPGACGKGVERQGVAWGGDVDKTH